MIYSSFKVLQSNATERERVKIDLYNYKLKSSAIKNYKQQIQVYKRKLINYKKKINEISFKSL